MWPIYIFIWLQTNWTIWAVAILLLFSSGCTYQQTIQEKYPVWGNSFDLHSEGQKTPLHMQLLETVPPGKAQACLLIIHGMNEYIGRYGSIAREFADKYIVAGIDLAGHGLSNPVLRSAHQSIVSGKNTYDARDAYLEQVNLRNLQPMRKNLAQALQFLSKKCDEISTGKPLPIFILSHSLGSLVTASYMLQIKNEPVSTRVKGIIFTGPAFSVTDVPGWRGWLQNPLVRFSFHTHQHFLTPHNEPLPIMLLNQLLALITVPLQDGIIELLSLPGARNLFSPTTPIWVEDYLQDWKEERIRHRADNYIIRRSILRYVLGVEKEIIQFRQQMEQFETPYLLIYSENDPITPAWGNIDFAAATRHHHKDNAILPLRDKSHHEQLFSEPVLRGKILKTIRHWLRKRIQS